MRLAVVVGAVNQKKRVSLETFAGKLFHRALWGPKAELLQPNSSLFAGIEMDNEAQRQSPKAAEGQRRVGRPTTLESGGTSLATILTLIRAGAATTRIDIERKAELGRAVVADRLATLEQLGLVEEGDLGPAMGGRAPRQVRFRAHIEVILGAHVDRTSLAVGLADLAGNLIVEHHEAADLALGPEPILDRLTTLFLWLLDERGGKKARLGHCRRASRSRSR